MPVGPLRSTGGRSRRHIQSNLVAYLALFLLLTGATAYAANTISSGDIVNGQVKTPDVGRSAATAAKLAPGAVDGTHVAPDSATGADVAEGTLDLGAAPGWNEVGDGDGPAFKTGFAAFDQAWANFDEHHNTVAFRRDQVGFVHLKGLVKFAPVPDCACTLSDAPATPWEIFTLPPGYRPTAVESQITLQQSRLAQIDVNPAGQVVLELIGTPMGKGEWASLDGISFRCAPAGSGGCP